MDGNGNLVTEQPRQPKYLALAGILRDQIRSGALKPGEKLPSLTQLRSQAGLSYGTVRTALLLLKAEGLIEGQQGDGTFVTDEKAWAKVAWPRT